MRTVSADLLAAQSAPDSEATVTARLKRRGTFAGDPLAWRPLFLHTALNLPYSDAAVGAAACACAENGAMVRVLRSQAALKVGVQRFNVLGWNGSGAYWPSAATAALKAAPTELYTLTAAVTGESTPGVGRSGSTIRAFYGDGGRVRYNNSANDGQTWGISSNVWNGNTYYNRLTNFAVSTGGGAANAWHIVFNGVTAAGAVCVRGIHSIGSGWVA